MVPDYEYLKIHIWNQILTSQKVTVFLLLLLFFPLFNSACCYLFLYPSFPSSILKNYCHLLTSHTVNSPILFFPPPTSRFPIQYQIPLSFFFPFKNADPIPRKSAQTHNSLQQSLLVLRLESSEEMKFPDSCDSLSSSMNKAYNVSSPSSSTIVGEYIGIESCLDLKNDEDIVTPSSKKEETNYESCSHREKRDQRWAKKKEFPPPISLLARTENLPSHMPWVLKRYYTSDGRLILIEEKVRHHEYFRAHRSNGRLTLHLVPLDDEVSATSFVGNEGRHDIENDLAGNEGRHDIENDLDQCYDNEEEEEQVLEQEEEEENESLVEESIDVEVNDNDGVESNHCVNNVDNDETVEQEEVAHDDQRVPSVESSGSAGKCLNYNSVRTSSTCIFGVPVPAIRPVHT